MINGHSTYWQIKERPYPSKRYVLIFDKYRNYDGKNPSITEYDSLDELHEETKLLNEYYKDTPRPVIERKRYRAATTYSFSGDAYFWGYIVLDFKTQKVIESGNDGINIHYQYGYIKIKGKSIGNNIKDFFFRKDDEIPKNYQWDIGEYEGWLQYRWGDGKNAIGYVGESKSKNKNKDIEEDYEGNFEGYLPCTLEEELSESEYIDAGNTLDKKETTSSIADMLGEDNPLLKLKFDK